MENPENRILIHEVRQCAMVGKVIADIGHESIASNALGSDVRERQYGLDVVERRQCRRPRRSPCGRSGRGGPSRAARDDMGTEIRDGRLAVRGVIEAIFPEIMRGGSPKSLASANYSAAPPAFDEHPRRAVRHGSGSR